LRGIIVHVSEAFCNLLGYDKSELVEKTHKIIRYLDGQKDLYRELYSIILRDGVWKGTLKVAGKDGGIYWFDTVVSPIYNIKEKKIGYSIIGHNVTDKKNLEKMKLLDPEGTRYLHNSKLS